ncbi:MAG: TNT domain-containing protein [Lachnospiraceae bacterium]|nr:TNT domain-containing protein [Lachnospiraceae bacterium]
MTGAIGGAGGTIVRGLTSTGTKAVVQGAVSAISTGARDVAENAFFGGNKSSTDIWANMGISFVTSAGISYLGDTLISKMNAAKANSGVQACKKAEVDYSERYAAKGKADFYAGPSGNVYIHGKYPDKDGALGDWETTRLELGTIIDRYGSSDGKYFSPIGTPIEQRSLAPWADISQYHKYEVIEEIDVESSIIAPYFDQPGGGIQYKSNNSAVDLIKQGKLKEVFGD